MLGKVRTAGTSASVTRRSAGLPLIVASIVASESATGKQRRHLLDAAVEQLLEVLEQPLPGQQVRAIGQVQVWGTAAL